MTEEQLTTAMRPLWEEARLLAACLCGRDYETWESLICEVERQLSAASDDWKAEVLRAHPRLGEAPETLKDRSLSSWSEQGAGRSLSRETAARLEELNMRYEARFGFPFVEWVAGRPLEEIADVMEQRMMNDRSEELDKGSAALVAIACDRLSRIEAGESTVS